MTKRDFWKIVLTSSIISAGVVLFLLRWTSPGPIRAEFAQPAVATLDHPPTEDETINIQVYEMLSRGVVNVTR